MEVEEKTYNAFYTHEKYGEVPVGWELKSIGEYFDFFPVATYSRSKLTETGDCGYVHYGDIHTLFNRFIDLEKDQLPGITKELAKRYTRIEDGDLIISDASEDYEGVGKAVEVINTQDRCTIAGLHTLHLRPKENTFVTGLPGYLLNHDKVRLSILRSATGIKVYSISKGQLKRILLPRPPIPEQRAIRTALSIVDDAIDTIETSIIAAEKLKKSLMQNLLTGKLKPDGTWRSEDDYYLDEKYGKIPKGWVVDRIKNLTTRVTDGEHLSPDFQNEGSYLLSAEDVFDDGVRFTKPKYVSHSDCQKFRRRCDPEFGDVLIVSRGASIGRTCRVSTYEVFCLMGSVILLKPDESVLFGGFLAQYLKTYNAWVELQKLSGTTAQQAIYLTHIKKVRLSHPLDIEEQRQISEKLEEVDNLIADKVYHIQQYIKLKKALIQNLLSGRVRLSEEMIEHLGKEEKEVQNA